MKNQPASPVSYLAHVSRLPQKGIRVTIEADDRERKALASAHGLDSVESYRADLHVSPWKRNGVKVSGRVEADITQSCVITLEPVVTRIDEAVEAVFIPQDSKLGRLGFEGGGEMVLDPDGPDSPETFFGDTIDVGALAEEFFGLAIDPYPRSKNAVLPEKADEGDADGTPNPLRDKLRLLKGEK